MCDFCSNNSSLTSNYLDIKIETGVPTQAVSLVVYNIKKGCPKYADCCVKDINIQAAFEILYCPMCGKKL